MTHRYKAAFPVVAAAALSVTTAATALYNNDEEYPANQIFVPRSIDQKTTANFHTTDISNGDVGKSLLLDKLAGRGHINKTSSKRRVVNHVNNNNTSSDLSLDLGVLSSSRKLQSSCDDACPSRPAVTEEVMGNLYFAEFIYYCAPYTYDRTRFLSALEEEDDAIDYAVDFCTSRRPRRGRRLEELLEGGDDNCPPEFNNVDINCWDVSEVTEMVGALCPICNGRPDLDMNKMSVACWDVSSVEYFTGLFAYSLFNEDIDHWDVRMGANFSWMFLNSTDFDQCLSSWADKLDSGGNFTAVYEMFYNAGCPDTSDPDPEIGPWCQGNDQQCFEPGDPAAPDSASVDLPFVDSGSADPDTASTESKGGTIPATPTSSGNFLSASLFGVTTLFGASLYFLEYIF